MSEIFALMPVALFKLASCETTTCSSFVRWQSSSSMSVPRSTALHEPTRNTRTVFITTSVDKQRDKLNKPWSQTDHYWIQITLTAPSHKYKHKLCLTHTHKKHPTPFLIITKASTHCLKAAIVFSRFSPAPVMQKVNTKYDTVFSLYLYYCGNRSWNTPLIAIKDTQGHPWSIGFPILTFYLWILWVSTFWIYLLYMYLYFPFF